MGTPPFLISLLLLFSLSPPLSVSGNPELTALIELKASLDPQNARLASWTVSGDPCGGSFEGVACNDKGQVVTLSLQGKRLSGELSPAIGGLKHLTGLYLHYNSLHGEIPGEISALTELTDLYLNVNSLSGDIPPELGHLASLQGSCSYVLPPRKSTYATLYHIFGHNCVQSRLMHVVESCVR